MISGVLAIAFALGPQTFRAGDTSAYLKMVAGETVSAPFAYRVMVPTLVSLLPVPPEMGFLLLSLLFSFLTLFVFNELLVKIGVTEPVALITTAATGFSYPIAYNLGHWGLVDPAATFFVVLALYALFAGNLWGMALAILVGVVAKESLLFLVPLPAMVILRQVQRPLWVRLALAGLMVAVPVLMVVTLRLTIPTHPSRYDISSAADLRQLLTFIFNYNFAGYGVLPRIVREFLRSYGFFWTFGALGLALVPDRQVRIVCIYLVAISVGLCLIATDWSRMLIFGFPGIFIPAAFLTERYRQTARPTVTVVALLLLAAAQGYAAMLSYEELARGGQLVLIAGSLALFALGSALGGYLHQPGRLTARLRLQ